MKVAQLSPFYGWSTIGPNTNASDWEGQRSTILLKSCLPETVEVLETKSIRKDFVSLLADILALKEVRPSYSCFRKAHQTLTELLFYGS